MDAAIPDWLVAGARCVWTPYCQMKGAPAPLPVARTHGVRIVLEDGRELVDGIASWWTACHGYNQRRTTRTCFASRRNTFRLSSGAASVVTGTGLNGRIAWK